MDVMQSISHRIYHLTSLRYLTLLMIYDSIDVSISRRMSVDKWIGVECDSRLYDGIDDGIYMYMYMYMNVYVYVCVYMYSCVCMYVMNLSPHTHRYH